MASNTIFRFGPMNLTASAANLLNPGTVTGGVNSPGSSLYAVLRHIRIVNRTNASHQYQLFIGATGGSASGTEFMGYQRVVPANGWEDWYGAVRLGAADFLTGLADTTACLTIEGEGEVGIVL
jgi:hypothetical protein